MLIVAEVGDGFARRVVFVLAIGMRFEGCQYFLDLPLPQLGKSLFCPSCRQVTAMAIDRISHFPDPFGSIVPVHDLHGLRVVFLDPFPDPERSIYDWPGVRLMDPYSLLSWILGTFLCVLVGNRSPIPVAHGQGAARRVHVFHPVKGAAINQQPEYVRPGIMPSDIEKAF